MDAIIIAFPIIAVLLFCIIIILVVFIFCVVRWKKFKSALTTTRLSDPVYETPDVPVYETPGEATGSSFVMTQSTAYGVTRCHEQK